MRSALGGLALLALLPGCSTRPCESERDQMARLRASYETYIVDHLASIRDENRLATDTLVWLNDSAVTAPRAQAVRDARHWTERWAKVYFVPRYMHEQLRYDLYSSRRVKMVQQQLLTHMKQRYFELHDYQRYAQYASESGLHSTPPGRLPAQLVEFRQRLEVRTTSTDRITSLLAALGE